MDKMPVLFIGHGSPMNAIENNIFTETWRQIASILPQPRAILCVSAHWFTSGTRIQDALTPQTIYDMYGFPEELYEIVYNAPGSPELAHQIKSLISSPVVFDNTWGIDHGTWSVLHVMYPKKNIPVIQLSVDAESGPDVHYLIGRQIQSLRKEGVLILGSGNVVHNLGRVRFDMEGGFDWADEFDRYIRDNVIARNFQNVLNFKNAGKASDHAFPIPDHFYPLMYVLGAADETDTLTVYNDARVYGSLSMTSFLFS